MISNYLKDGKDDASRPLIYNQNNDQSKRTTIYQPSLSITSDHVKEYDIKLRFKVNENFFLLSLNR